MKIQFTKMTGAGNDFVVIDNRAKKIKNARSLAKRLCDRRWGIGADGLLLLEPSKKAAYRMMYYNADGSYGGMCGNGGRCIARFAVSLGVAGKKHSFDALDYIYTATVSGNSVALQMKDPKKLKLDVVLPLDNRKIKVHFVDTGSPHVVIPTSNLPGSLNPLEKVNVFDLGRKIRYHRVVAPKGANVNFIELHKGNSLKIRTYERGVEDETLACGTGSIAAAVIGSELYGLKPPVTIIPKSKSKLSVNFKRSGGHLFDVNLSGPAEAVFSGTIEI